MAVEKKQNIQEVFLNYARKNKTQVTMFLVNGIKLQGAIIGFDNFSIVLRRESHVQVVYKHAISTIMPNEPVKLYPEEEDTGEKTAAAE
jgi:host factor-I protein